MDSSNSNHGDFGHQRFSDIHRLEMHDGFIVLKAKGSRQYGDKQNLEKDAVRDKLFTPRQASEWANVAEETALRLAMLGDMLGSAELSDICKDLRAKVKEAIEWREKHNMSPDEKADILKWKKTFY